MYSRIVNGNSNFSVFIRLLKILSEVNPKPRATAKINLLWQFFYSMIIVFIAVRLVRVKK